MSFQSYRLFSTFVLKENAFRNSLPLSISLPSLLPLLRASRLSLSMSLTVSGASSTVVSQWCLNLIKKADVRKATACCSSTIAHLYDARQGLEHKIANQI
eukprot:4940205-Amphidinium_carterae.1